VHWTNAVHSNPPLTGNDSGSGFAFLVHRFDPFSSFVAIRSLRLAALLVSHFVVRNETDF
jgi:hypothetical protein